MDMVHRKFHSGYDRIVMKSIVLTGVSRGLGNALHNVFAFEESLKDQKIFISRNISAELKRSSTADYISLDFSYLLQDVGLIQIDSRSKCIIFINNSGTIEPIGQAAQMLPGELEKSMHVNCLAPLQLAQHLTLVSQAAGIKLFIIDVSSGAANRPIRGWLAYCMSKAAAKMALDVIAAENEHVEVLHFDPGVMDTDMQTLVRSQSVSNMPDVDLFKKLKADQKLKDTSEVAKELLKIVKGLET